MPDKLVFQDLKPGTTAWVVPDGYTVIAVFPGLSEDGAACERVALVSPLEVTPKKAPAKKAAPRKAPSKKTATKRAVKKLVEE